MMTIRVHIHNFGLPSIFRTRSKKVPTIPNMSSRVDENNKNLMIESIKVIVSMIALLFSKCDDIIPKLFELGFTQFFRIEKRIGQLNR